MWKPGGWKGTRALLWDLGTLPTSTPSSCHQQLWGVPWVDGPRHEYLGAMVVWWSLGKSGVSQGEENLLPSGIRWAWTRLLRLVVPSGLFLAAEGMLQLPRLCPCQL